MKKIKLSSKARTLEELSPIVKHSRVLPALIFSAVKYRNEKGDILSQIQNKFTTDLIVRSSSSNEDNMQTSNAGGFESILNVDVLSSEMVDSAIQQVIHSYGNDLSDDDEVFVQPMLSQVDMSGVLFTSDIDTLSSYYIVNYDESGSTSSVTDGGGGELKTFVCSKNYYEYSDIRLQNVIRAAKECEEVFDNKFLDIEFAVQKEDVYILQVRAIVTNNKEDLSSISIPKSLTKLYKKIQKLNCRHPNLLGDKAIFGVMPDWNPAEIIGIRPKMLSLSLYKELITDETWAYQRDNYGYRNLRSHPLLVSFLGVPFIDVRISFNSFIPKLLEENIAEKLVNYYLGGLSKNINHHDKVEFEIIFSCYYFGIEKKLVDLKNSGFENKEIEGIKKSLLNLTNNIINPKNGLYKKDLEKIETLNLKYENIVNSELPLIDKIYWLIKDVKRYGTLPFAGIARAGFIAVQILRSLVDEMVLSTQDYSSFLNSISTISKELSGDQKILSKKDFIEKYGHLRPGTYDISSLSYDEGYDIYFPDNNQLDNEADQNIEGYAFTDQQKETIENFINDSGLKASFDDLMLFIKESIEGREYAKFMFSKHLSKILKYIDDLGSSFDFDRAEMAHLDIQEIIKLYASIDNRDVKDVFKVNMDDNKELYQHTKAIKLPSVIIQPDDVYSFFLEENEANYVTLHKIEAPIVREEEISGSNIDGKIICIKSADPGYDYLFSKNIGGLITCYGGANSHMAIRCAEMGIPAVIGCGEHNFLKYTKAQMIEINASNKQVKILS